MTFDTNTYAGALTVASEAGKPVVKISDDTELSGAVTLGGSVAWSATSAGTLWVSGGKVVHSNGTYALKFVPGAEGCGTLECSGAFEAAAANRWQILPSAKGYAIRRFVGLAIILK